MVNGVDVGIILGVLLPAILTLYYKLGKLEGKLTQIEKMLSFRFGGCCDAEREKAT